MVNSTVPEQCSHELSLVLPKGIWLRFDFGDSHPVCLCNPKDLVHGEEEIVLLTFICIKIQDLPTFYLQGGSIIPTGPPLQHVGEAKPTDEISLIIALDKDGILLSSTFDTMSLES